MLRYFLLIAASLLFLLNITGCTKVDCEVCCSTDVMGTTIEACETAKDVKKSDCEDCSDAAGAESTAGVTCKCTAK